MRRAAAGNNCTRLSEFAKIIAHLLTLRRAAQNKLASERASLFSMDLHTTCSINAFFFLCNNINFVLKYINTGRKNFKALI